MADRSCQSHGCTMRSNEKQPQIHLYIRPMAERRDLPSLSIGARLDWGTRQVPRQHCKIDISYDASYRQRLRYESTVYMRGVNSNKQAGPPCQRPDYKSSANALFSIQREQRKGIPHIPINLRTRRRRWIQQFNNTLNEWLSFNCKTYFLSSSSSTWTERPTWWSSSSWGPSMTKEWRDQ